LQQPMEKGDLSIFVFKNKKLSNVNIEEYWLNKDIEACALKLKTTFCIFAPYRDPSGNLSEFVYRLESPSLIYCIPTVAAANNNMANTIIIVIMIIIS
jgi:hypothetical protein